MARDEQTAHRTDLPGPTGGPEEQHEEGQPEQGVVQPEDYAFFLEAYSADCFVDTDLMLATDSCVVRGHFIDDAGTEVRVHVPTTSFFQLHNEDPNAPNLWNCLSLAPFFALPPWGPDLRRAWSVLCTLDRNFRFSVMDFQGQMRQFTLTRQMVRGALQLVQGRVPLMTDHTLMRKETFAQGLNTQHGTS